MFVYSSKVVASSNNFRNAKMFDPIRITTDELIRLNECFGCCKMMPHISKCFRSTSKLSMLYGWYRKAFLGWRIFFNRFQNIFRFFRSNLYIFILNGCLELRVNKFSSTVFQLILKSIFVDVLILYYICHHWLALWPLSIINLCNNLLLIKKVSSNFTVSCMKFLEWTKK